jgi:hypothetical protein
LTPPPPTSSGDVTDAVVATASQDSGPSDSEGGADPGPQQQFVIERSPGKIGTSPGILNDQDDIYSIHDVNSDGSPGTRNSNHKIELDEKVLAGNVNACTNPGQCTGKGSFEDSKRVFAGQNHAFEKRFTVDGVPTKLYDPGTKKSYDYVVVKASYSDDPHVRSPFIFEYHNR